MRVLFLLQYSPFLPSSGITWKSCSLIRYLAASGWSCDIICFGDQNSALRAAEFSRLNPGVNVLAVVPPESLVKRYCKKILCLLQGLPPSLGEFSSRSVAAELSRASANGGYDVVHYDIINMAQYSPLAPEIPSLLSSNDAISLSYERMLREPMPFVRKLYLRAVAALMRRYERRVYPLFNAVHVVSEEDAAHLRGVSEDIRTVVIPISVDDSYLDYASAPANVSAPKIVFTGNLDIPGILNPLLEFLEKSYPQIAAAYPTAELRVLGPKALPAIERRLDGMGGVRYYRWVDDYKKLLGEADIVLVLDRAGTGIKTRVLNAMALGRPVVASRLAMNGISAENGVHCLVQDSPGELLEAVMKLLKDPGLRRRMGGEARELMRRGYSSATIGPKWEELYKNLARPVIGA